MLLTKVTPGVGLLWFVARREWRSLALALGMTAAVILVTAVLLPRQWLDWMAMLASSSGAAPPWPALPVPVIPRLVVAAAIVWWGAQRGYRWAVSLAAAISVPALWPGAFAILAACWPLRRRADVIAMTDVASAPAASPDYHAADARKSRGEPRPSSA
ncbi:MAG: glycosyltransferase 87 family protein [Candidatus Limnocylindrales bacterium]